MFVSYLPFQRTKKRFLGRGETFLGVSPEGIVAEGGFELVTVSQVPGVGMFDLDDLLVPGVLGP